MKWLVEPLWWCLLTLLVGLLLLRRRVAGRARTLALGLTGVTVLLVFTATPVAYRAVKGSLDVDPERGPLPDSGILVVLGGGYVPGPSPEEDVLAEESTRRVLHAVSVWRNRPGSIMLLSGAQVDPSGARAPGRLAELMSTVARAHGVPADRMRIDGRSRNTREHPVQALRLAAVTSATPLILVTSDWHTRRARREFCRYFVRVHLSPSTAAPSPFGWSSFVPSAASLESTTTLLREWVGMLWYLVRGAGRESARC